MHGILLRVVRWLCRSVHRKIELPRKTKHFKTNCVITFSIFKVDQDDYPLSVDKKGVVTDILHHTLCFIVDIKWKPFLFLRQANDNWWTAVGQWETVKGRRVVLCVQYETKSSFFFRWFFIPSYIFCLFPSSSQRARFPNTREKYRKKAMFGNVIKMTSNLTRSSVYVRCSLVAKQMEQSAMTNGFFLFLLQSLLATINCYDYDCIYIHTTHSHCLRLMELSSVNSIPPLSLEFCFTFSPRFYFYFFFFLLSRK